MVKKKDAPKTTREEVDPMLAPAEKTYGMDVFFEKWSENLIDKAGWDWKEMKRRLAEKKPESKWFVVKSVDTLCSKDGGAPWVPNFIVFEAKPGVAEDSAQEPQAPRFRMKPAVRTDDMDPEAFISDDIVDMKGTHEWRKLDGHTNIWVLAAKHEKTDKMQPLFNFGNSGGFGGPVSSTTATDFSFGGAAAAAPAANAGFNFGAPAASSSGTTTFSFGTTTAATSAPAQTFSFGTTTAATTPAASTPSFSFGTTTPAAAPAQNFSFGTTTPAAEVPKFSFGTTTASAAPAAAAPAGSPRKRGREEFEADQGESEPAAKRRAVGDSAPVAQPVSTPKKAEPEVEEYVPPTEDVVFPILFDDSTIEDKRSEMRDGMKVIIDYKSEPEDKVAVDYQSIKLENDLVYLGKTSTQQLQVVRDIVGKQVLKRDEDFKKLREEYQGDNVFFTGDEYEQKQKEYKEKREALLERADIKAAIKAVMDEHGRAIVKKFVEIARRRKAKIDETRDLLTLLNKDLRNGDMYDRSDMHVIRVFPEEDSKGAAFAFLPSKKINKSVGRADDCYPKEFIQINGLTGLPM